MSWFGKSNKTQQIESGTGTSTSYADIVWSDAVTGTTISNTSPFYTSVIHYASRAYNMELISNIHDQLDELDMTFEDLYNLLHELKEEQK